MYLELSVALKLMKSDLEDIIFKNWKMIDILQS